MYGWRHFKTFCNSVYHQYRDSPADQPKKVVKSEESQHFAGPRHLTALYTGYRGGRMKEYKMCLKGERG